MSAEHEGSLAGLAVILVVGLVVTGGIVGVLAYHQVPEGHTGVTTELGAVTGETLGPGGHFKTPFMQGVQDVETRPRTYTMAQDVDEGQKKDSDAVAVKTVNGSTVLVDITVRYHIKPEAADQFVSEWNNEQQMEQRLIRPTIRTQLRDEASRLQTTGEGAIYTQKGREALEQTAIEALRQEFQGQPIVLEAVQIRNIDLPEEIDRALDRKEQAKQQVEVEKEKVKQEKARAKQKRIQAQAEADVIQIEGAALRNNTIVLEQQAIQAMDEGTVYIVPQGQDSPPVILQKDGSGSGADAATDNSTATGAP